MHVRVKEGCSVGIDGVFNPGGTELNLPAKLVVQHQANLEPVDEPAKAFFAAITEGEQA
jgi:hypothetical protein